MISDFEHFLIYFWGRSYVFSGEMPIQVLCPFFKQGNADQKHSDNYLAPVKVAIIKKAEDAKGW